MDSTRSPSRPNFIHTRPSPTQPPGAMSKLRLLTAVSILATALAACSPAALPGTPPVAWASTMCTAMSGWVTGTQQATASSHAQIQAAPDSKTAIQDYEGLFNSEISLTQQLISKVNSAGSPAVKDGSHFAKGFIAAITSYQSSLQSALSALQAAAAGDQSQVTNELGAVQQQLNKASNTLSQRFQGLYTSYSTADDLPLIKAITSNNNCKSISAG